MESQQISSVLPQQLISIGTVVTYASEALIYMEMDPSTALYVLLEGQVRTFRYDAKGNEIILPLPGQYDLLGELPVDEGDTPTYRESCEAESSCKLLRLNSTRLCRMAQRDLPVANFLLAAVSRRSRALTLYTCITSASSLSEKVARFLYAHEVLFVTSPLTRIAGMLNVPPESLSRILKQFRNDGVLVKEGRHYKVVDVELLRNYFDFVFFGS